MSTMGSSGNQCFVSRGPRSKMLNHYIFLLFTSLPISFNELLVMKKSYNYEIFFYVLFSGTDSVKKWLGLRFLTGSGSGFNEYGSETLPATLNYKSRNGPHFWSRINMLCNIIPRHTV